MAFEFTIDPVSRIRLSKTGFDPTSIPHEYCCSCDLCGWQVFRTVSHIDRYGFPARYQMCEGCGLVFQNPRPTAKGYAEFYEKWYRPLVAALKGQPQDAEALLPDQRAYAAKLVRFLQPPLQAAAISFSVDLGGSTGCVAKAVQDTLGGTCLVVDPSPSELSEARKLGLECEEGLAEQWNPQGRRFDLALICRSVDHLLSISSVLAKLARCLRPGGFLFVDPVDFETWARTMEDYRKLFKMDHVYYLSDETMRLYLRAAGFEIVASDFGDGTHISYLTRCTGKMLKPIHETNYAYETGRMLRERLVKPMPPPYPVDPLTRLIRLVRQLSHTG